jgi:hypothetical protein
MPTNTYKALLIDSFAYMQLHAYTVYSRNYIAELLLCLVSYLALNRLYRVYNNCYSSCVQCLKRLLCVDVNAGQPAAKPGVRVIPSYYHLWPVCGITAVRSMMHI